MKIEEEFAKKFPLVITEEDVKYHIMNRLGFLKDYVREITIQLCTDYKLRALVHFLDDIDDIYHYKGVKMIYDKPCLMIDIDNFYSHFFNTPFSLNAYARLTGNSDRIRFDIILVPYRIFTSSSYDITFPISYKLYPQLLISDLMVLLTDYGVDDFYKYEIIPNDFNSSYMLSLYYRLDSECGKDYISNGKESKLRSFVNEYGARNYIGCKQKSGFVQVHINIHKLLSRKYGRIRLSAVLNNKELLYFEMAIGSNNGYHLCIMKYFNQIEMKQYRNEDVTGSLSMVKDIVKLINEYRETKDERKDQLITT